MLKHFKQQQLEITHILLLTCGNCSAPGGFDAGRALQRFRRRPQPAEIH